MGNIVVQNPNALDFRQVAAQYSANFPGREILIAPFYDRLDYAGAGQSQLKFFQTPNGQSSKTLEDTNMNLAGQLPNGFSFLVEAITLTAIPSAAISAVGALADSQYADDIKTFFKRGVLSFNIMSRPYHQVAPLGMFPPKTGLAVGGAASNGTTLAAAQAYTMEYATVAGPAFTLGIAPIMLEANANFDVTLAWPGGVLALPSNATMSVYCHLWGALYRTV